MKLYLVRHGHTSDNTAKVFHNHNSALSQEGLKQAEIVADRFKKITIEKVFSSPAKRAEQTAQIIADAINCQVEYLEILRELKRPTAVEGKHYEDPDTKKIMAEVKENFSNSDFRHSDEENFFEFTSRIDEFINMIEGSKLNDILTVSHEVAIKMIVARFIFGKDLTPNIFSKLYPSLKMSNTGITLCEHTKERGWRIITWNDYAHLG